uniref:Uncharacterized protein n=1 Tax=Glossina austeni TaxID=7395 RepID=A0A1A9VYC4_GLOAU
MIQVLQRYTRDSMRTHVNTHHIRDYPTKLKFQEHVLVNDRLIATCHALTFKPFLRSRYSMRWTKTTEAPKHIGVVLASTTPQDVSTSKTLKVYDSTLTPFINNIPSVKTSTHLPDYDYYGNNELDDSDRN